MSKKEKVKLEELITIQEAGDLLNVSYQAIDYRVKKGHLEVTLIGGHPFVLKTDVSKLKIRQRKSDLITIAEAAKYKNVSRRTINYRIRVKQLELIDDQFISRKALNKINFRKKSI